MGIPENIDALMAEYDIPASSIARAAGVSEASVSDWRNKGVIPRRHNIEKLCEHFGLTQDDILSDASGFAAKVHGRLNDTAKKSFARNPFIDVPLYGAIAAGTPIEMVEVDDYHPVPTAIHDRYPEAFLLKVRGNSMDRVLPDGCYALVDPCDTVELSGEPYAVCVNGFDATIKRVRRLNNGFELVPDSTDPTYATQTYNYNEPGTETITVIGRVVYYVLPFDWKF